MDRNGSARRATCAVCGDDWWCGHRCRRYSPARAAAAAELALPNDAGLSDVSAVFVGTPAQIAYAAAHLPEKRRDALWTRLADERSHAHDQEAVS